MKIKRPLALLVGGMLALAGLCGCLNPTSMGLGTPIPIMPWVTERMQEKYNYKNDQRTPVMPPIKEGTRPFCEDPPTLAEVLRAMPGVTRGVPYLYEEFRDNISFTYEKVKDSIDPARFFPLIGPAQLHHCHWKCTVYFRELIDSGYPFPFQSKRNRVEVIYMDKDHLHLFVAPDRQQQVTREMTGY